MVCNVKDVKKTIPATFAWALLLFSTGLFFAYPCWYLTTTYSIAIPIVQGVITFFVITNFTLVTFLDPGVIPKAQSDEWKKNDTEPLYVDVEIKSVKVRLKWCMTCHFFRPPRCTHCGVCDSCIEVFDHHCPWLNNCIGHRNYRFFYFFLVWLSIHKISIFCFCILYMYNHLHLLHEIPTIVTLSIIVVIIVFIIPILGLTAYHSSLILRGRTTNEQVTGKFHDVPNPYALGGGRNLMRTLCSSLYPSFQSVAKKSTAKTKHSSLRSCTINHTEPNFFIQGLGQNILPNSIAIYNKTHFLPGQSTPSQFLEKTRYSNANQGHREVKSQVIRGSRAVTPPVLKQDSYRFHHLRRSLPAQCRVHSSTSLHNTVDRNMSCPIYDQEKEKLNGFSEQYPSPTNPQKPQLFLVDNANKSNHQKRDLSEGSLFSPSSIKGSNDNFLLPQDTYCIDNRAFDRMQEPLVSSVRHYNAKMAQRDVPYEGSWHGTRSKYNGTSTADLGSSERPNSSRREGISERNVTHFTGRRPLSFVKAIEMSDSLDTKDPTRLSTLSNHVVYDIDDPNGSRTEVSYEICV